MAISLSTAFFILSNLSVAPFYLLMIAAPRSGFTRRVIGSLWPVAVPALVYVVFVILIIGLLRPDVIGLWRALYLEHGLLGASTAGLLSSLYGGHPEYATLHGWVHILVGDIMMARWAYLDALERGAGSWQISVCAALTGLFGPIALIAYLVVRPMGNPRASAA